MIIIYNIKNKKVYEQTRYPFLFSFFVLLKIPVWILKEYGHTRYDLRSAYGARHNPVSAIGAVEVPAGHQCQPDRLRLTHDARSVIV